jgi:hypothetical protein
MSASLTCPKLKSQQEAIWIFALSDLFLFRTESLFQQPIGPVHIPFGNGHVRIMNELMQGNGET